MITQRPARPAGRSLAWPWLDRSGRVSLFKAMAFALALLPAMWLLGRWLLMGLGARPLTEAIHQTGLWAVRFLLVTLAITPARFIWDWPRVVVLRRMAGLTALAYATAHLGLYVVDQNGRLGHVAAEIVSRRYLTIGFVALVGLAALGITSTDPAIRRMGRRWKTLHRTIYLLAALGVLHFFMQSKADVSEAAIMAGLLVWLLLWRLLPPAWRGGGLRRWALLVMVPVAALATAGLEAGWYGIATRVPAYRVLAANWHWRSLPRPATWVAEAALAAWAASIILAALRRAARRAGGWRGRATP